LGRKYPQFSRAVVGRFRTGLRPVPLDETGLPLFRTLRPLATDEQASSPPFFARNLSNKINMRTVCFLLRTGASLIRSIRQLLGVAKAERKLQFGQAYRTLEGPKRYHNIFSGVRAPTQSASLDSGFPGDPESVRDEPPRSRWLERGMLEKRAYGCVRERPGRRDAAASSRIPPARLCARTRASDRGFVPRRPLRGVCCRRPPDRPPPKHFDEGAEQFASFANNATFDFESSL
jgi:hypothetical protein